jgi:Leucine-rich repeat (LRR) protein
MSQERVVRKKNERGYTWDEFDGDHFDFQSTEVEKDVRSLIVKNASTIDLSSVENYEYLRFLSIETNNLHEINLSPLREALVLGMFVISSFSLRELDLTPLKHVESVSLTTDLSIIDLSTLQRTPDMRPRDRDIALQKCTGNGFCPEGLPRETIIFNIACCKELQSLDLTPLSDIANLRGLVIGGNGLESIDLTPLASCSFQLKQIPVLNLSENNLTSIDLSPLTTQEGIRELTLDNNKLEHIDLRPLRDIDIMYLKLHANPMEEIDVSTLLNMPLLREVTFPADARIVADKSLKDKSPYWLNPPHWVIRKDNLFTIDFV